MGNFDAPANVGWPAFFGGSPSTQPPAGGGTPWAGPAVFTWTGAYIGANLGYGWGQANTDFNQSTNVSTTTAIFQTGFPTPVQQNTITFPPMLGAVVLGVVGDIQGSGQRGGSTICLTAGCPAGSTFGSASYSLPWFATVRGRVGVPVTSTWLLYGTGGLALADVQSSFNSGPIGGPITATGTNGTRTGFAVGGGIEHAINHYWFANFEAVWVDVGAFDTRFAGVNNINVTNIPQTPGPGFNTIVTTTSTATGNFRPHVTDLALRLGLNYHFGAPDGR